MQSLLPKEQGEGVEGLGSLGNRAGAGWAGAPQLQGLLPRDSDWMNGTPDLGRAPEANVQNYYHLFVPHEPAF